MIDRSFIVLPSLSKDDAGDKAFPVRGGPSRYLEERLDRYPRKRSGQ